MRNRYSKAALRLLTCILVACSADDPANKDATGAAGVTGAAGDKGTTGDKGPAGDKGTTGDKGPTGDVGPAGPAGDAGTVGSNGYVFLISTSTESFAGSAYSEFVVPLNNVELASGNTLVTAAAGVGRYTVQRAGVYLVSYNLNFTNAVAASTYLSRNGSPVGISTVGGVTVTTKRPSFASTVIVSLAAGDVISLGLTKLDEFSATPQPEGFASLTITQLN